MSVFRVNKTKNYTVMSNTHFKEKNMSLKAKGLLSMMLSLPDDWDYSIKGLVALCKENESAIKTALDELKEFGYLVVHKLNPSQTDSGRFEYVYCVYEEPQGKQEVVKQGIENLPLENLGIENHPLYKETKKQNTKELNTINSNTLETTKRFVRPSFEEVAMYCCERKNNIDAQYFLDFYDARGWMIGKNHIKDWKACVRTWERNRKTNYSKGNSSLPKFLQEENNPDLEVF